MPNPFRLKVLERARALSIEMHRAFRRIHIPVNPDLKSQLLRAGAAMSRNLAEGAGRDSPQQLLQFLAYAIGSANETEECLRHIAGLDVVAPALVEHWLREISEIRMMMYGLRRSVEARLAAPHDPTPPTSDLRHLRSPHRRPSGADR